MGIQKPFRNIFKRFLNRNTRESKENLFIPHDSVQKTNKRKWSLKFLKHKPKTKALQKANILDFDNPLIFGSQGCLATSSGSKFLHTAFTQGDSERALCNEDNKSTLVQKVEVTVHADSKLPIIQANIENTPNLENNTKNLIQFEATDMFISADGGAQRDMQVDQIIDNLETVSENNALYVEDRNRSIPSASESDEKTKNVNGIDEDNRDVEIETTDVDIVKKQEANMSDENLHIRQLQNQLVEKTNEVQDTRFALETLHYEFNAMNGKLEQTVASIKILENKYDDVVNENTHMAEKLLDVERRMTLFQNEIKEFQNTRVFLEHENIALKCKLEEAAENIKESQNTRVLLQMLQDENIAMDSKLEEAAADIKMQENKYEVVVNKNTTSEKKLLDMEHRMNLLHDAHGLLLNNMEKISGDMKRLKRKTNKAPVIINKTNNCQVYTAPSDFSRCSASDASSSPSESSSSSEQNPSPESLSPADLSPDDDAFPDPEVCGQDQTYRKEVYQQQDVWDNLQNLDYPEVSPNIPMEAIEEDIEQTYRKEVVQATETMSSAYAIPDRAPLPKKMDIGQLYEGFLSLHNAVQSGQFNALSNQLQPYMKIIDHIILTFGQELYRFLDVIAVPLHTIPEEICMDGNRMIIATAVYTWCCRQSGPNATGSSLAKMMSELLSNFKPSTGSP